MFHAANQNRIFQDVVKQIQEAIMDGRLKSGDTLPAERDLKSMFNTSRGTLREALRVLEERGLIEIKLGVHGGGVVKGVTTDQATRTLARLIRTQQVELNHLAEFREGVEGHVASLAAQRARPDDVAHLQTLLQEAQQCIVKEPPDRNGFLSVDRRFHQQLARISQNPVYTFVLETVHENIHRYYDRYLSMKKQELEENFRDLSEITRAVAEGKADEARLLAQSHVLRFYRRMSDRMTPVGADSAQTRSNPVPSRKEAAL